jgi:hypothetical protein
MNDMVVIDDMHAVAIGATAGAEMGYDERAAEKRLEPVIVKMDPQPLPDQL